MQPHSVIVTYNAAPLPHSAAPLVSDPGMHQGTCVTHVPWCMPGSLAPSHSDLWWCPIPSQWLTMQSHSSLVVPVCTYRCAVTMGVVILPVVLWAVGHTLVVAIVEVVVDLKGRLPWVGVMVVVDEGLGFGIDVREMVIILSRWKGQREKKQWFIINSNGYSDWLIY